MAGTILTTIGLSKLAAATPQNQLNITHIAVGDGNGGFPTLSPTMTALTNEVWRGDSSVPVRSQDQENVIFFEVNIPPEDGGFTLREIAIFDNSGAMIAIGHTGEVVKPEPTEETAFSLTARIFIALENASQVGLIYQDTNKAHHNSLTNRDASNSHPATAIQSGDGRSVEQRLNALPAEVSAFVTAEADRAEAAADNATVSADIYSTVQVGLNSTAIGEQFNVFDGLNYIRYLHDTGDIAVQVGSFSGAAYAELINENIENLKVDLTSAGLGISNETDVIAVLVDANNRVILGVNKDDGEIYGSGIAGNYLKKFNVAIAKGDIYPLLSDINGKTLVGYDSVNDEFIGAGLSGKFSNLQSQINQIESPGGSQSERVPLTLKPENKTINQVISYGQSLSIGAKGEPVISTTQPYSNLTFDAGPRAYDNGAYSFLPLKPLFESAGGSPDGRTDRGETICSAWANYTKTLLAFDGENPNENPILASAAGKGGSDIVNLKKTSGWYNNVLLEHVIQANNENSDHAVNAVTWIQGETDVDDGTTYADYKSDLSQLVNDFDADIKSITGQSTPVFVLEYQLSYGTLTTDAISKTHLEVAEENDNVFVVTPTYHLPHFTDETHLTNVGYKIMGAYFAKSYKEILDGYEPKCLKPISATFRGTELKIKFDTPRLPLVIDTSWMKPTEDNGFYVQDGSGKITIESIIAVGDEVLISLSSTPNGDVEVRYAYDYAGSQLGIKNSASGNLRDSDDRTINILGTEYNLYNPCVHFKINAYRLGE